MVADLSENKKRTVQDAVQSYHWNSTFASSEIAGMSSCYVTNEKYNEEENFLQARFLLSKTVPGTHKYHCFKPINNTMVEVKQYSAAEQKYKKKIMKNAAS